MLSANRSHSLYNEDICAYSLKDLLSLNIVQSRIQILDFRHNIIDLALVLTLNGTRLSNGNV